MSIIFCQLENLHIGFRHTNVNCIAPIAPPYRIPLVSEEYGWMTNSRNTSLVIIAWWQTLTNVFQHQSFQFSDIHISALNTAVLVSENDHPFALPITHVQRMTHISEESLHPVRGHEDQHPFLSSYHDTLIVDPQYLFDLATHKSAA